MTAQDHLLRKGLLLLVLIIHLIPNATSQQDESVTEQEEHQQQEQQQQDDLKEQQRLRQEKKKREEMDDLPDDYKPNPFEEEDPFRRSDIMLRVIANPKSKECVFHLPKENFRVFFQLVDGPKVIASVRDPSLKELFDEEVKRFENGHIDIGGRADQPFEICVHNEDGWKKSLVAIEIGHPDRIAIKANPSFDYLASALQTELREFRLRSSVLSALRARHTKKMEKNLSYINYWSCVQTAAMITAGVLQVVLIRSLFDEKSIVSKYFWSKRRTAT